MKIAIDGPAASGKSTTAKLVAKKLNFLYIDTGAMYRAITYGVLKMGIPSNNRQRVEDYAKSVKVSLETDERNNTKVILNDEDITLQIRTQAVSNAVSEVCAYPEVRKKMVELQRQMSKNKSVVLDGRDIGTVVFPDAEVKIFMVADIHSRALRRHKELQRSGDSTTLETLINDIQQRDHKDSTRSESPLRKAESAFQLDTSGMTIEQQVEAVIKIITDFVEE